MDQPGLTARVAQTNPQVLHERAVELARLAKLARDPVVAAELELFAAQNMARAQGAAAAVTVKQVEPED